MDDATIVGSVYSANSTLILTLTVVWPRPDAGGTKPAPHAMPRQNSPRFCPNRGQTRHDRIVTKQVCNETLLDARVV